MDNVWSPPLAAVPRGRSWDKLLSRRLAVVRRIARRLPSGGMLACVLVCLAHGAVRWVVLPEPKAREKIRAKVATSTRDNRPRLIIAGDSRARRLLPATVCSALGWSEKDGVNIAGDACASATAVAAYQEFADRFAPSSVMVLSVSAWSANDRYRPLTELDDEEVLWSVGPIDRLRIASPRTAFMATFARERWLILFGWRQPRPVLPAAVDQGGTGPAAEAFTEERIRRELDVLSRVWFNRPRLDGVRWKATERDIKALLNSGVQVVLFSAPRHPAMNAAYAGGEEGKALNTFEVRLVELGSRLGVPVLRYGDEWCPRCAPDEAFADLTHVNQRGAEILSRRIGEDLRRLIDRGTLRLPQQPGG